MPPAPDPTPAPSPPPHPPQSPDERHAALLEMAKRRFGDDFSDAEQELLRAVVQGGKANVGTEVPVLEGLDEDERKRRTVRAVLLRWLLTETDAHELFDRAELWLQGALIDDQLDLEYAEVSVAMLLVNCSIDGGIVLREARTRSINLSGSRVSTIHGDGLVTRGWLFLRSGFTSTGEIRLLGADIGGVLDCKAATLQNLIADGIKVRGVLFLRNVKAITGILNLTSAHVRTLVDDAESWPEGKHLFLGNFRYDEIFEDSTLDAKTRLDWLAKQPPPRDLNPQPYRQLASVLRRQGHEDEARKIMLAYWWKRTKREINDIKPTRQGVMAAWNLFWRSLFGLVVGFGYARWLALVWLIAFWLAGAIVFSSVDNMKQANPIALRSQFNLNNHLPGEPASANPKESTEQPDPPPPTDAAPISSGAAADDWVAKYPAYNPLIFSLDTFLPIVNLHQETYWTPDEGWRRYFYLPFHIIMGWVVTTLFAISFTGLVRKTSDE